MTTMRRNELRRRAEELVRTARLAPPVSPNESVEKLLHEMSVYEEELEIQNEELRGAQTELLVSQRRFAELFEDAPLAYFVLDEEANIRELNARAEALLARSRTWLYGKPLIAWIASESHLAFGAHRLDVVQGRARARVEIAFETKGAHGPIRRRMLLDSVRVADPGQKTGRILTAAMDVTELREAEAQRRRAVARYTNLLEHSRDATFLVDALGTLVDANPAACQLLGRERAELIALPFADLAASGHHASINELIEDDRASLHELALSAPGGALVWVEVSISRIEEHGGGSLIVARDLTERRAASAEHDRLEAEIGKSQRLDALGRLAGGIAHDINNVLSAVLTIGVMLHDDARSDDQREDLGTILAAARRGADLTKRLLAFARGEQSIKEPLSMGAICREVVALVSRTADRRVRIELDCDPDQDLMVDGDAGALSQVLLNLCVNSLDAMPDGGAIYLSAKVQGASLEVRVHDSGSGMDARTAAHAFDPFFSTKPTGKGTGLGLAMVYGTVKKHGGSVALESVPGKGTTVVVTLPRTERRSSPLLDVRLPPTELRGTCLLVDDDPMVRHASSMLLKRLRLDVTSAEGGPEALEMIEQGRSFDLYLVDLNMPGVDGVTLVKHLLVRQPTARVLLCSGYSPDIIPPHLLALPKVRFVGKPFSLAEINREIATLLAPTD